MLGLSFAAQPEHETISVRRIPGLLSRILLEQFSVASRYDNVNRILATFDDRAGTLGRSREMIEEITRDITNSMIRVDLCDFVDPLPD